MTDQVTITHTPDTKSEEAHNAAMIAKVDGQSAAPEVNTSAPEQAPAGDRPSWLPEEFKTPEEMAAAFTAMQAEKDGKTPEEKPADAPKDGEQGDAEKVLSDKGLSFDDFSSEFAQTGTLSADSYTKLEQAGIPKAMVDSYIAGQQALAETYRTDVMSAVGGAERFDQVAAWAAESLTDAEKVAYNKAIDSGNAEQAKLAVAGLAAKFDAANPTEGNLIGGRFTNALADRYESTAQITTDMSNPLYKTDPAFRKKVMEKIGRSDVI